MPHFTETGWREKFWRRVRRGDACWEWTGRCEPDGYARVRRQGPRVLIHRASYEMAMGAVPAGLCVLHKCDNRRCVRPAHLFVGTQLDNVADRDAKGRQSRGARHAATMPTMKGEGNGHARLTEDDVRAIRRRYAGGGTTYAEIGRQYLMPRQVIGLIVRGIRWSHVPPEIPG